jgi:hypothetical protein
VTDATESAAVLSALHALADRLVAQNLAIYGVAYDFLHFGSWTVEAGRRHKRTLVQWDGKESTLTISTARTPDAQSARNWQEVARRAASGSVEAIILAEQGIKDADT